MVRALLCAALVSACSGSAGSVRQPGHTDDSNPPEDSGTPDTDSAVDSAETGDPDPPGPCPDEMALIDDAFCMDRWEGTLEEQDDDGEWVAASPFLTVDDRAVRAVSVEGVPPQGYISGTEAEAACQASGKRLCSSEEWLAGCRGDEENLYPYGDDYDASACNDTYEGGHPVLDYFVEDDVWDMEHMNHPGINQQQDTVALTGSYAECVTETGLYDLHGNLHEWVADSSGTFRGGFYADAKINGLGCTYATGAHEKGYHDYSTGFRCCAERAPE